MLIIIIITLVIQSDIDGLKSSVGRALPLCVWATSVVSGIPADYDSGCIHSTLARLLAREVSSAALTIG